MRKKLIRISAILALFVGASACSSVPVTGRKQMMLVSNQQVLTLSLQQYGDFMKEAPVSKDAQKTAMVREVGQNIANAVERYLRENGMEKEVSAFSWEFNLVKDDVANAFCMPGGKIVVYEGILPIAQDATGLAVVLGHEVAHAVAKHANERMSQEMASQYGGMALTTLMNQTQSTAQVKQLASAAFGLGTKYGILLPYSRKQELEADELGLIFMAMAGYNPQLAAGFWQRMSQKSGGSTSEFTSTHPSDQTRINKINEHLATAMTYYKPSANNAKQKTDTGGNKKVKTDSKWSF